MLLPLAAIVAGPAPVLAQPGVLRGRVVMDSTEIPVAGTTVSLPDRSLSTMADSLGRFHLSGIPPGRHRVLVRRLGFAPVASALVFARGDTIDVDFLLSPVAQSLPDVEVTTTLLDRKLADFEERRRFGIGHFLNTADLERAPGTRMTEKVRHLPGLVVIYPRYSGDKARIASTRGSGSIMSRSRVCDAAIILDGILVTDISINDFQPSEIAAVEWYAGPSQIPMRFGGTRAACAVLMLWTR